MRVERTALPHILRMQRGNRIAGCHHDSIAEHEKYTGLAAEDHADEHEVVEEPDRRTAVDAAVEEEDARHKDKHDQNRIDHRARPDVIGQDRTTRNQQEQRHLTDNHQDALHSAAHGNDLTDRTQQRDRGDKNVQNEQPLLDIAFLTEKRFL